MPQNQDANPQSLKLLEVELNQLNDYARSIFGIFANWWAFFIAQNLVAGGFVIGKLDGPEDWSHRALITIAIVVLNLLGSGFALLVSLRLVIINDRIVEICESRPPDKSPLGNPVSVWRTVRQMVANLKQESRRISHRPLSPIPLRFYLWCTLPVATLGVWSVTGCWIGGLMSSAR